MNNSTVVDFVQLTPKEGQHILSANNTEYTLALRINDISDEKELNKFIKNCEKLVRLSPEYKLFLNYVHEVLGFTRCQISGTYDVEASSEVHHHPITLYNYIKGIILKKSHDKESFCSFDIAMECIENHFDLNVPFCYLLKSYHELYHNDFLKLPMELVYGDPAYFLTTYGKFLSDEEQAKIYDSMSINSENCGWNIKVLTEPNKELYAG